LQKSIKGRDELVSELGRAFLKTAALRIGDFKTSSGAKTPYYIDLRRVPSFPNLFSMVIECLESELNKISKKNTPDAICGIPITGLLLGSVIARERSLPLVYSPTDSEHRIIGVVTPGANVLVVDDVSETGISIVSAAKAVRANGGVVSDALTLLDRSEGAKKVLAESGVSLHSFATAHELALKLKENLVLSDEEAELVENHVI
jgi:orotate phosphoribosyltransferase